MKTCSRCKRELSLDAFGKKASNRDGFNSRCKECERKRDHERRAAYSKKKRQKIREQERKCLRKNRAANPEKYREKARKYRVVGGGSLTTYFVLGGGLVKIGRTKNSIKHRLCFLQTGSPVLLTFLAVCTTPESDLHEYFADDREHHEWFRDTPVLRAFVKYIQEHGTLPPRTEWFYLGL